MRPMHYAHLLNLTRRHPSAILLVVQLAGLLLYPFLEDTPGAPIALGAFGICVLIITTRMVRRTPGLTWISVCIALASIEMFTGVMYLAAVVSRLIGLTLIRR